MASIIRLPILCLGCTIIRVSILINIGGHLAVAQILLLKEDFALFTMYHKEKDQDVLLIFTEHSGFTELATYKREAQKQVKELNAKLLRAMMVRE